MGSIGDLSSVALGSGAGDEQVIKYLLFQFSHYAPN